MSSSLIGKSLGNYKVTETLGQGGMAAVYLGYQESVDRQVAIKVLPPHPGLDKEFVQRFELEAKTIAKLQHPHILPLYDYGSQDDILYLVMAYVDGGTLEDYVSDGPMPLHLIEKILREIAGALDYAHRRGVIHRDIKPGNILMDSEGHALLADFGIAKLSEGSGNLTGTSVVGTPSYMAPEQAQGSTIDPRADIYSLGVVVYQMITGQLPFTAETLMQVMIKVIQEPPPNILEVVKGLPDSLGDVMDRVMAKKPEDRYQTATEFADAFSKAVAGITESATEFIPRPQISPVMSAESASIPTQAASVQASPPITTETIVIHRHQVSPLVWVGGLVLIIAVIIVGVLVLNSGDDAGDETPTEQSSIAQNNATATTAAPAVTPLPSFGRVSYTTVDELGDSLSIRVEDLRAPGDGMAYVAWLKNIETGVTLNLGELTVDALGEGSLSYTDASGALLPAFYNALAISLESQGAVTGDVPQGDIVYNGTVPVQLTNALYEIFISSPDGLTPGNTGYSNDSQEDEDAEASDEPRGSLIGAARIEARTAAQHAGLASNATTVVGLHTHAEHTINILAGTRDDLNGDGRPENPGRGVGIYFFLDAIQNLLVDAIQQPDADITLQANAEFIFVCLNNTRIRADRIQELERQLLASDSLEAAADAAQESTVLAQQLVNGFDLNDNGQIEQFEGECGLNQIEQFGLLVGSLNIQEGALAE